MSHKKHHCSLDIGSDSMLPSDTTWSVLCRAVRKTCLISQYHPATYRHFRSYPTVIAERQRQLNEGGPFVIHPFSNFILFWDSLMSVVNIAHMIVSSLRLCYVLPSKGNPQLQPADHILLTLHLVCLVDVVLKFHVGYLEGKGNVILDRSLIACNYLKSWLLVDLISSLPISYGLLAHGTNLRYVLIGHLIANLKALRIGKTVNDIVTFIKKVFAGVQFIRCFQKTFTYTSCLQKPIKNKFKRISNEVISILKEQVPQSSSYNNSSAIFGFSYIYHGPLSNLVLFLMSAHWCSCIIYISPVLNYYWTGMMVLNHNSFLNATDLTKFTMTYRYRRGIFISMSAFMGTGFSMHKVFEPFEVMIHVMLILYAALFMIYTLVNLIKVYFTKYHSVVRYNELMNQLDEYMRHKQFPAPLKKRVSAFYYYNYQGNYFREDLAFDTLSEQLRNEIVLHTCHKLVDKVELFDGLPASVVGSVLGCLRAEVYLPNDLVVRAGDIGDCMYFIANGTVAVYSLKGVEVCHLEDGAYFGEVALLMKDSKRVATVVAVEITQVYRLDAEDFRHFIMSYQVLYERIEVLASQRMHETVLVDEAFRRNREQVKDHIHLTHGSELHKSPFK